MSFGVISCVLLCVALADPLPKEEPVDNSKQYAQFFRSFFNKPFENYRIWNSHCGKYSVEAKFVDITDDVVRLEKRNGVIISVPFEEFSKKDRVWIRKRQSRMKTP